MRKRERGIKRKKREVKLRGKFSLFLPSRQILGMACVYRKFSTSRRSVFIVVSSPPSLAEFSTHTRRKRTRKMFAHALDRPVCHDGDSLHPSTPASLPCMSHPSHLSCSITPSPLHPSSSLSLSLFLSLARTHAGVVFLPSFSLFSRRYPSPPLFDAGIPAKTICQNAGRGNCKASSTLFNLKI